MYTPRYDPGAPIKSYSNYQNRLQMPTKFSLVGDYRPPLQFKQAETQQDQEPQAQQAGGTPLDKDARFARANIWKSPGWYDLPEWLRTDMLSKSLEQEGGS
jgi:hypothetical protein